MPTTIITKSKLPVPSEDFAASIADLLIVENDNERVIGQAWIGGQDLLVTCGHIVAEHATKLGTLIAKFPATKKRYSVLNIRMHPQYHKDAPLFGSDMAVLTVELSHPERELAPLPVLYQKKLSAREQVNSLRFNLVDGRAQRSEAVAIAGQFCGWVEKPQSQHLIHNLPLSAENIGCPIFDGDTVVAIHCGNVPLKPGHSSADPAKLALSINALKELNLSHYRDEQQITRLFNGIQVGAGFIVSFFLIATLYWFSRNAPRADENKKDDQSVTPIIVKFNQPLASYVQGNRVTIDVQPHSDCYLTIIVETSGEVKGRVIAPFILFYPLDPDAEQKLISSSKSLPLGQGSVLTDQPGIHSKLHIFACKDQVELVKTSELDPAGEKDEPREITAMSNLEKVKERLYHQMEEHGLPPDSGAEIVVDLPDPAPAAH